MSKCMKKNKTDLQFLAKCSQNIRKNVLKNASPSLIKAIKDIVLTILSGRVRLTQKQKAYIRKNRNTLSHIATKQKPYKTLTEKRKVLSSQRGGNIIAFLLNAIKSLF